MNRASTPNEEGPLKSLGPLIVQHKISDTTGIFVMGHVVHLVEVDRKGDSHLVIVDRDDAIEASKIILTKYRVPFCNRVS